MFAAIIIRDRRAKPSEFAKTDELIEALTPFHQADKTGSWKDERATIVQALTWNTASSKYEETPEVCKDTGRVIASWARLDNRHDLCERLGLVDYPSLTDPQIILAAHRAWGSDCANQLEGDFSFFIYDPTNGQAFAARDSLGIKPCFYYCDETVLVIASTAAVFPKVKVGKIAPNPDWIARYLIGQSADPRSTAYDGVWKIPPAHHLTVSQETLVKPERYFSFQDLASWSNKREERWVRDYRQCFDRAVSQSLRSAYRVGAESSGGLDSSSIVAQAVCEVWHGADDFHCFGICHMEHEPRHLLATAMHCGIKHTHVLTKPYYNPSDEMIARSIAVIGHPAEHTHAMFHVPFYELCNTFGIRTLLSGFGGDEMVTNTAGHVLKELLFRGEHTKLLHEMPGSWPLRLARLARFAMRNGWRGTKVSEPPRYPPRLQRTLLRDDVVKRLDLQNLVKHPSDAQRSSRTVNEYILARPGWTRVMTGRLESCTLMAASYGIDYRWPLLDRRLIQQFLATPAIEKYHRGTGRYLHRRAMNGLLPSEIVDKPVKDMGSIVAWHRNNRMLDGMEQAADQVGLLDLVDPKTLSAQIEKVRSFSSDQDALTAGAAERNNLRSVAYLIEWLK